MISKKSSKENKPAKVVIICGPTGSGKSDVGMYLAEKYGGRIISADSRQIYRGLDIGTAKPSLDDRNKVRHYLVDIADVNEDFTAKRFAEMAQEAIAETLTEGEIPFVVGGAGLYLEALTEGLFSGPDKDEIIRQELQTVASKEGPAFLYRELKTVDPVSAERIMPADTVRIIRALEVYRLTGRSLSELQKGGDYDHLSADFLWVGLTYDRKILYERINSRVDAMIADGLVKEVNGLLMKGLRNPIKRKRIVGYYEIIDYIENNIPMNQALELIKQHTRNYAKRQITWFKNKAPVLWVNPNQPNFCKDFQKVIDSHLGKIS